MIDFVTYFLIGIGLSIDSFLVCLSVACDPNKNIKAVFKTPFIIAIFHIIFPIGAYYLTHFIVNLSISAKIAAFGSYIGGSIFIILGLTSLVKQKQQQTYLRSLVDIVLLSLSVSIDSILIGMSFGFSGTTNIYLAAIIFGLIAGISSIISIKLGRFALERFKFAHLFAGFFFIILGVLTFLGYI